MGKTIAEQRCEPGLAEAAKAREEGLRTAEPGLRLQPTRPRFGARPEHRMQRVRTSRPDPIPTMAERVPAAESLADPFA
jgi:hypothetical protein